MTEIWKDIVGYEGRYQVSNLGMVRSLDAYVKHSSGGNRFRKGRVLKQTNDKGNYKIVGLHKNGVKKCKVHRLVAQAFIPNPNNYPMINHKDENPSNNRVDNLEYCDCKYNNNYGRHIERIIKKNINNPLKSKPVLQYTKDGEFIKEYPSIAEAERQTGIPNQSISHCCCGRYKTIYGYVWKHKTPRIFHRNGCI